MAKTDKKNKKDVSKKAEPVKVKAIVASSKEILAKAAVLAKAAGSKKLAANGKKSSASLGDSSDSSSAEESSEESDGSEESSLVKPIARIVKKSDGASDGSSSEESSSEESDTTSKPKTSAIVKTTTTPAAVQKMSSSSDSSSDSSASEESDDDEGMVSIPAKTSPNKGKQASESEDDSSDGSSSEELSSGSESDEEMDDKPFAPAQTTPVQTNKKRKADSDAAAVPKKAKNTNGNTNTETSNEETRSIWVGQLSWNVDNDWLAQEFAECGEVESARVQMDRDTGRSRGFGHVHFKTADAVEKALALNGKEIDGREVRIDKSNPPDKKASIEKRAQAFGDTSSPPSTVLFVGNLSFGVNEDTLWETFGEHGDIKSVRVPTDRDSGRPKGFAYVEFSDIGSAKTAHGALQGFELDGRSIRLDFSQPRDSAGGRGGGQGGRGGWGRGGYGDHGRGGFGDRGRGGFGGDRGRGGFGGNRGRGGFGGDHGRGGFGGRGAGRGGRGGRGGERGGRGRGSRTGGITQFEGQKITF